LLLRVGKGLKERSGKIEGNCMGRCEDSVMGVRIRRCRSRHGIDGIVVMLWGVVEGRRMS
jgi:hypothetical protein